MGNKCCGADKEKSDKKFRDKKKKYAYNVCINIFEEQQDPKIKNEEPKESNMKANIKDSEE